MGGAHLKKLLKQLGSEEIPEFPGYFFFKGVGLMLSTYVDDLTLSGPADAHEAFWAKLTKMINVEPPEPIFRVLGRNHVFIDGPAEPQEHDLNAAVSALKGAVAFDMNDYARQTVELFCSITGTQTPFCPDGSLPSEDDQSAGELAPNACKLLMKALWLGRLGRPDIIKPIGNLATAVQKWSRNHDRQLARLIAYLHSTTHYRLVESPRIIRKIFTLLCMQMPTMREKGMRSPHPVASWFSKDRTPISR